MSLHFTDLDSEQAVRAAFEDSSGSLKMRDLTSVAPAGWNYLTYVSGVTTDTYAYYTSNGGTLLRTVVITYSDSTKTVMTSVALS